MDPRLWGWVRWPLTVLGFALVVAITAPAALRAVSSSVELRDPRQNRVKAEPAPDQLAGGPVSDGSAPAIADFVARGGTVAESKASELVLTGERGSAVVLAFPVIPGNSTCVGNVWIEMTVLHATPTELGSFGASAHNADDLADGAPLPAELLMGDQPSWRALTTTPGRLRWDVTSAYRDFLTSGQAPAGSPFVAAISATRSDQPDGVRFAASESRVNAPALIWSGVPGCQARQVAQAG
ncbi:MAG: hypothetical protein ACRDYX_04790 [Egibacteraceae bacterium]